jgi:hypothetical protein
MYEGLKDKVVLITGKPLFLNFVKTCSVYNLSCSRNTTVSSPLEGSSGGIGAGAAEIFAKHGAKLVLTGRNQANLEKVARNCADLGIGKENVRTKNENCRSHHSYCN